MIPPNTLVPDLTDAEYNALPGIRSTELKHALKSAKHWKWHKDNPSEASEAMRLGSAVHAALLQPERYRDLCRVAPAGNRTKAEKEAQLQFSASLHPDSIVVGAEDARRIEGILQSVSEHRSIREILEDARAEHSLVWECEETHAQCKMRADAVTSNGRVFDVKTTSRGADFDSFSRQIFPAPYQYHVSAAHYLSGLIASGITREWSFGFIAVETTPPYAVALYAIEDDVLEVGRRLRREAIFTIQRALKSGSFEGYVDHGLLIEAPAWMMRGD